MANELQTAQIMREVICERDRQIQGEGFSREHDDRHKPGELARCGAAHAYWAAQERGAMKPLRSYLRFLWPWPLDLFKPKPARRALVVACAFLVAEIEKIDRERKVQS